MMTTKYKKLVTSCLERNSKKFTFTGGSSNGRSPTTRDSTFISIPNSISFFSQAIEVCDANMMYVEDHLDEACGAFLPGCHWCPWDSRLTREVTP